MSEVSHRRHERPASRPAGQLRCLPSLSTCLFGAFFSGQALAQEVVIDRPVRAGDLTLFPSAADDSAYYYVADRAELVRGPDNVPEFSFIEYVDTLSGAGEESAGGGLVHAVVELGVDQDVVDAAGRALSSLDPDGEIRGAVPFRSGKFALVSGIADPASDLADAVIGVGNAPLLEGERAAVSIRLSREGAELMRASLDTSTTDLSFSFEMQIEGYRAPKQATLVADFDRIYEAETFQAGAATPYLQAEIETTFDELRTERAIQLTEIGSDEQMEQLIQTAYNKLIEIMFKPAPSSGTDALDRLEQAGDGENGLLARANSLLTAGREEAQRKNEQIRQRNAERAEANAAAVEAAEKVAEQERRLEEAQGRAESTRALLEQAQARLEREQELRESSDLSQEEREVADQRIAAAKRAVERHRSELEAEEQAAAEAEAALEEARASADEAQQDVEPLEEAESEPGIAIVASYQMKESRVSGTTRINLNKYTSGSLPIRFDRNLGDLRPFLDDVTSVVDVGATAFQRREVGVLIDGMDAEDFGEFVNSASVILTKTHDDGSTSQDTLSVNRVNFDAEANNFTLAYNRLGDDRDCDFLSYEYAVLWNFFGGIEVAEPPERSRRSDITLSPPYTRRSITIEADPEIVEEEGIRAILVTLFVGSGDRERTRQVTLRPDDDGRGLSEQTDFVQREGTLAYDYEVRWIMADGSTRSSGRKTTTTPLLLVDTLRR